LNILKYVVQAGDSIFGIADRFGLNPETVLWGNFDALEDNPHSLKPGQELNILPVDGTLYVWKQGDGLVSVAGFFGVTPQDILDWPGNPLPQDLDLIEPAIEPGTPIVIPGGRRETVDWRAPRITRANPASARILGPGFCGEIYDGPIGAGFFVWPTPSYGISGYTFDPFVHPAIDIGGGEGNAIFAVDAGVVVYAGWHNGGYGNVVVIDHGNGWQSLYAHLSSVSVGCGDGMFQGNVLGGMGSTGNSTGTHLHYEMQHDEFGKVNPLNFLP
jgi:murein DD-endopeptidase MepM/ murein hydrolase activator NlpD